MAWKDAVMFRAMVRKRGALGTGYSARFCIVYDNAKGDNKSEMVDKIRDEGLELMGPISDIQKVSYSKVGDIERFGTMEELCNNA